MSRLPLELIDMIADELKDISYRKKIHKWLTVRKYLENLEQVPNYRLQRGCGFYNIGLWEHREHADTYLSMLTQLVTAKNLGKFAEYKKVEFRERQPHMFKTVLTSALATDILPRLWCNAELQREKVRRQRQRCIPL